MQLPSSPLFSVHNKHSPDAGSPPSIDGDDPNAYHSYFENTNGEQSLFAYRHDTSEAVIYSGGVGWAAFPVVDGAVSELELTDDERIWLSACLTAIELLPAEQR